MKCRQCSIEFSETHPPGACHRCGGLFCPQHIECHRCEEKEILFGSQALQLVEFMAAPARAWLSKIYGPAADVRFAHGGWRAGYKGFFGFTIRGRGPTPETACLEAFHARIETDPTPANPQWPLRHTHRHEDWIEKGIVG